MKVTKEYLQQVINEEIQQMIEEGEIDEGILNRIGARVGSAVQGVKGGIKSAGASLVGKVGGVIDPKLGAAGAKVAQDIRTGTAAKQRAVKIKSVVLPKIQNMENDLKIIFKGEESKGFYKNIMKSVTDLRTIVNNQLVGSGVEKPTPAPTTPAPTAPATPEEE